ncbi:MAG: ATP phosphoribosyltransferase regulatory subunit [Granulosicoccaceae bacterium]|jgi:ATP phosphoribosyltransferase regulatory subunit
MTTNDPWLLPEGIEEVLPPQADRLEQLRRDVLDVMRGWGYELVMPPFIDYLDSLLTGTGNDLDLQTFKLTDQLSGRLMGIRADMTPQVARMDAHQLQRDTPTRLCYLGTVLRTRPEGLGGSRSPLQLGAELYGHAGCESDVEIIRLMQAVLATVGINSLHIDLGHVGIYRGLVEQAGLDAGQQAALFDAMQRKAVPEIEQLLNDWQLASEVRAMLRALVDLNGDRSVLETAADKLAAASDAVRAALDNLRSIADRLPGSGANVELFFDLAELRGYYYHTGVMFAAYLPRHGQAVAWGGRYDDIGKVFGRARPATGFSADLQTLVRLGKFASRPRNAIFAPADVDAALEARINELRAQGECVVRGLPGQSGDAAAMGCTRELVKTGDSWVVKD